MKSLYKKVVEKPIILLLALNVIIGLFTYRAYGLAWDEPLFYSYGDALGYAYTPAEWFSGNFDLNRSYGASGDDHKTRGPAYLLLAREFVYGLKALGADEASAWHLVNFIFFQLGVYFLYRTAKRWMSTSGAFFASAFFSFQPLLWGHAFINPKDPPFLTFFLASLCLGFEMVDSINLDSKDKTLKIFFAAFVLGIATSIRILAPLAGLLIFVYFIFTAGNLRNLRVWRSLMLYGFTALITMLLTWPFLWENLLKNFVDVFILMSDNPTNLSVLFGGNIYSASELPRRYLPVILATTLTEPVWPLFGVGFLAGYWKLIKNRDSQFRRQFLSLSLVFSYFLIVLAYVLVRKPAMYDGMRHFFFILPPIFIFSGFAFEFINENLSTFFRARHVWIQALLGSLFILPGIMGINKLHPYEYAYYNSFIGGTDGASRNYETDYWLTCYKEAVETLNNMETDPSGLYVFREAYIARKYANDNFQVVDVRKQPIKLISGDYVLINSRTNEDLTYSAELPIVSKITRGNATFCVTRQVP